MAVSSRKIQIKNTGKSKQTKQLRSAAELGKREEVLGKGILERWRGAERRDKSEEDEKREEMKWKIRNK